MSARFSILRDCSEFLVGGGVGTFAGGVPVSNKVSEGGLTPSNHIWQNTLPANVRKFDFS